MARTFDRDPVCCGVCRREAWGVAFVPDTRKPPFFWLCQDPTCIKLGKTAFYMTEKQLSAHEGMALHDAGTEAGAYLDSLGKTDLGDLNAEQWHHFLKIVLDSFGKHMRERLLNHAAPF